MARELPELQALLTDFKDWYVKEIGEYSIDEVRASKAFEEEKGRRIARFIQKRLGHLPDADFFRFIELAYNEDKIKEAAVAIVADTPLPTEVKRRGRPPKEKT